MNRLVCGLAALIAVVPAGSLAAQDQPPRAGLGMSFSSSGAGSQTGILIPLNLTPRRRLEPEVSLNRLETDQGGTSVEQLAVQISVGLLFFRAPNPGGTRIYVGPRFGVVFNKVEASDPFGGSQETERLDWLARLVAGGEHMFSPHFSLGGEARLTYYLAGDPEGSGIAAFSTDQVGTGAAAFLRWYF